MTQTEDGTAIDIAEILSCLPHRYPMLLVDRVINFIPGKRCRGIKNVTINEHFFVGHYPGNPVMPGVLIIEAMAQVGAVLLLLDPQNAGKIPLIGSFENAKFRKPVRPGDQLIMDIELLWFRSGVGKVKAIAQVDGQEVASMEGAFKLLERTPID